MLFHILDFGVLAHEEAVHAVVLAVLAAAVVDAAAGHDDHVRVLADIEVVVHRLLQAALGEHHGDVHALVFGAGLHMDVDAAAVCLGDDLNVGSAAAARKLAVGPEVIGALGHAVQIRDLLDKALLDGVKLNHVLLLLTAASGRR